MPNDNIEMKATLSLDTKKAEQDLKKLAGTTAGKPLPVKMPEGQKIELPKGALDSLKSLFTGDKGLANIGKVARGATSGLTGLTSALAGMVPALGIAMAAITAIITLLKGTDTMQMIQATFSGALDALRTVLAPALAMFGEILIQIGGLVADLVPVLHTSAKMFEFILMPIVAALKHLRMAIAPTIKIVEVLNSIFDATVGVFFEALESLMLLFGDITALALKPLLDLLSPVIHFFEILGQKIRDLITSITFGIISFDRSLASTSGLLANSKTSLDVWEIGGGGESVTTGEQMIVDSAQEATERQESFLSALFSDFKIFDSGAWSEKWDKIKEFFRPLLEPIKSILNALKDAIIAVLTSVAIAINAVATVMEGVANIIKSILDSIASVFTSLAGTINSIKNGINKIIISPINAVLNKIKGVSLLGAKPFDFIKTLKSFRHGGTIGEGMQVWGMSEQGNPEFIFNAGGHSAVINAEILEQAMYRAVIRAQSRTSQEIKVSVKEGALAGPRELAQWILPSLRFML